MSHPSILNVDASMSCTHYDISTNISNHQNYLFLTTSYFIPACTTPTIFKFIISLTFTSSHRHAGIIVNKQMLAVWRPRYKDQQPWTMKDSLAYTVTNNFLFSLGVHRSANIHNPNANDSKNSAWQQCQSQFLLCTYCIQPPMLC